MTDFYLVPHFEEMQPRDFLLLGFYTDRIVVPDGLIWWKFYKNNIPLLSHLNSEDQSNELFRIAKEDQVYRSILTVYAELVRAQIINHVWLASDRWALRIKRTDSTTEREAISRFNTKMKQKRQTEIINRIRDTCLADPTMPCHLAIKQARQSVGNEIISSILQDFQERNVFTSLIEKKLKQRFAEHLRIYLRPERFAHKWALQNPQSNTAYAGYLADVVNDFECNCNLIPIFAPPEIKSFLSEINRGARELAEQSQALDPIARQLSLAYQLGFNTLNSLPDIGFQGVEEVLLLKEKLGEELINYNTRMRQLADTIQAAPGTKEAFLQIKSRINTDLAPAINELEHRIKQCKPEIDRWLIPGVLANIGSLVISSVVGIPTEVLVGIGAGLIGSLSGLGSSILSRRRKLSDLMDNPRYFGLSLALSLKKHR